MNRDKTGPTVEEYLEAGGTAETNPVVWLPMDTAPEDGTEIIGSYGKDGDGADEESLIFWSDDRT
jgi:hypothetical protein